MRYKAAAENCGSQLSSARPLRPNSKSILPQRKCRGDRSSIFHVKCIHASNFRITCRETSLARGLRGKVRSHYLKLTSQRIFHFYSFTERRGRHGDPVKGFVGKENSIKPVECRAPYSRGLKSVQTHVRPAACLRMETIRDNGVRLSRATCMTQLLGYTPRSRAYSLLCSGINVQPLCKPEEALGPPGSSLAKLDGRRGRHRGRDIRSGLEKRGVVGRTAKRGSRGSPPTPLLIRVTQFFFYCPQQRIYEASSVTCV